MVRSLLRLDPDLPNGRIHLDPVIPPEWLPLRLEGMRIGNARVDISVGTDGVATITGSFHSGLNGFASVNITFFSFIDGTWQSVQPI